MKTRFDVPHTLAAVAAFVLTGALLFGPISNRAFAQQQSTVRSTEPTRAADAEDLHSAARTGDVSALRSRLQQGASVNLTDDKGQTPLMVAAQNGQTEAMKVLIEADANVNAQSRSGRTALIEAAEEGQAGAAKLLIQSGADVNAAARTGTALETAERAGHNDIAAMLRDAGARTSGRSVGDTVCVRPWGGNGYCGLVESIDKDAYRLRVTQIIGCKDGCPAKAECSDNKSVGAPDGIAVGTTVNTQSWCLTHTGVK